MSIDSIHLSTMMPMPKPLRVPKDKYKLSLILISFTIAFPLLFSEVFLMLTNQTFSNNILPTHFVRPSHLSFAIGAIITQSFPQPVPLK